MHPEYGAEIMGMRGNGRRIVSGLSETAAERDGRKIACRPRDAALKAAGGGGGRMPG